MRWWSNFSGPYALGSGNSSAGHALQTHLRALFRQSKVRFRDPAICSNSSAVPKLSPQSKTGPTAAQGSQRWSAPTHPSTSAGAL